MKHKRSSRTPSVRRYLSGDPETFHEIDGLIRWTLNARYPRLVRENEDLIQTVHQKLLASLRSGQLRKQESMRSYIVTIVHRTAIDELRRRHRASAGLPPHAVDPPRREALPYDLLELRDRRQLLHRALQMSSDECRELWRLIFVEDLSYGEIARRLKIPRGTVKSRVFHCRRRIRELLRELEAIRKG